MISDLPNTATKKKRDSAQKESELAVEYVDEQVPCAHKKCTNPDGLVDWLDCAGCEQWFHDECVGVDPKIVNEAFKFYCSSCEIKSRKAKDSAESKMNKSFNTNPVRSNNVASDVPVSDKKISVTNPLKKHKSDADEMNTIAKPIHKLPLSLTMPCSINISHLSRKLQKSLGFLRLKGDIEKPSETNSKLLDEAETEDTFHKSKKLSKEQSTELSDEPSRIQSIEPSKEQIEPTTESSVPEQSSLEQTTEISTPAERLTFTKIGPNWEFSDENCTLEELFQNVKNVVPISPIKTPDQREIGEEKETNVKRNNTEGITKTQSAESVTVGPAWPFPPEDFILKRLPSEVIRNYRPLTVGPQWGFSDEEFNLDNSQIFEKIKELNWGSEMESKAYDALRLGHADQINQMKIIPATSLKTLEQRRIENLEARKMEKSKNREAKQVEQAKEREGNASYLTAFLGIDYIPNNVSVKVTEEVKRRGPAKQSPFMKAVQERKRKIADANQSNCVQPAKMRKIGQ